jgi:hypothetical protein
VSYRSEERSTENEGLVAHGSESPPHEAKRSAPAIWWRWLPLLLAIVALVTSRPRPPQPRADGPPAWQPWIPLANFVDRKIGWSHLPWPVGLPIVVTFLRQLRRENLYDPSSITPSQPHPAPVPAGTHHLTARTADGTFNDLGQPEMGSANTRFGRNVMLSKTFPEPEPALLMPNPRTVSRELLTREAFLPAETLNLLVAPWIQFLIRDWFSHGPGDTSRPPWQLPLAADDPWPDAQRPMTILRTVPDHTRLAGDVQTPPTFINTETHWWDASQIYGSNGDYQRRARSGVDGKLRVDANGLPELAPSPAPDADRHPADIPGFWVGLAMLHTLFTLEHNAICDRFRADYPSWSDDELFDHARLVNAALLAKIHTVEWTPAIINHPTTVRALRGDWWGLQGERLHRLFGRLRESEIVSGLVGSPTNHFGVPYALTEEFVAVYRMHPLLPDDYVFRAASDHGVLLERDFRGVAQRHALDVLSTVPMRDLFYSFGVAHPGQLTLHNFPRGLQEFQRPDGRWQDLAATDVLRMRELGVPRYTAFRKLLHLPPVTTFEELTDNAEWAQQLRRVYDDDIDRVDLMVGMFAEPKPSGFAFSDTAFRVFVLMATRRITSDRFFTTDFTPRVYTQTGLDWIANNTMATVILRHFPSLRPALRTIENAFHPWTPAA